MKLLYIIILLLGLLQLALTKCPDALAREKEFIEYYDEKLKFFAKDISVKLKNISEQILEDYVVQHPPTPMMEKFEQNVTHFKKIYLFYERCNHSDELIKDFANMVASHYYLEFTNNTDSVYILQLLNKLGYKDIRNKYKNEFKQFVSENFLPKFEVLNLQVANEKNVPKFEDKLLKWVNNLKECQEYECYLIDFTKSSAGLFSAALSSMFKEIMDSSIIYSSEISKFARGVLKDQKLSQLRPALRQQLKQNLHDVIKINENIYQLYEVFALPTFDYYILFKFDNYSSISLEERQFMTKVLDDHGYAQLELMFGIKYGSNYKKVNFSNYFEEFENVIFTQDPEILKQFFDVIDSFKRASTAEERLEIMKKSEHLSNLKIKEPIMSYDKITK